jgi:hypothetical protein
MGIWSFVPGIPQLVLAVIVAGILLFIFSIKSMKRRVFAAVLICATIATGIVIFLHMLRPVTDVKSAVVQANKLIASAGGPAEVCDEASQIFKRFAVPEREPWRDLTTAELEDYPVIAALGKASEFGAIIRPGETSFPPRIEIRVGTRLDGYTIHIVDTTSPIKYPTSTYTAELVESRIFVSRPDPRVEW